MVNGEFSFHAPRGMPLPDAPRRVDAERPGGHSHVERGNEKEGARNSLFLEGI